MSIKEAMSRHNTETYITNVGSEYSTDELITVAEDILGYDSILSRIGLLGFGVYGNVDVYETSEDEIKVNSIREEPYNALDKAAELLENDKVEVIE